MKRREHIYRRWLGQTLRKQCNRNWLIKKSNKAINLKEEGPSCNQKHQMIDVYSDSIHKREKEKETPPPTAIQIEKRYYTCDL